MRLSRFPAARLAAVAIVAAASSTPVFACNPGEKPVFACTTTKGKVVEVCAGPVNASYAFGRPGMKPELRLVVPGKSLVHESESGTGASTERLRFANGKTTYTVEFRSYATDIDENGMVGEEIPDEGGIEVRSGGLVLAVIECKADTVEADFAALTSR